MAEACNNIGKELSLTVKQSSSFSSPTFSFKQRKSNSPQEGKKSLKRTAPTSPPLQPTKKSSLPQISYYPRSPFALDSLFYYHLNKSFSLSTFDFSFLSSLPFNYSVFSPSVHRSPYFMDSILSFPFICNWTNSTISNRLCGKHFSNHIDFLEHLYTEHASIKSSYPNYFPSTLLQKL